MENIVSTIGGIFAVLYMAHRVGDYLIQTEHEALHKAEGDFWNFGLISHCAKYTASFILPILALEASLWWLLPIFASHMLIDRRWPVLWWRRVVMRGTPEVIDKTFFVTVEVDQCFHQLVLIVMATVVAL